jgi:hypothetical protein
MPVIFYGNKLNFLETNLQHPRNTETIKSLAKSYFIAQEYGAHNLRREEGIKTNQ